MNGLISTEFGFLNHDDIGSLSLVNQVGERVFYIVTESLEASKASEELQTIIRETIFKGVEEEKILLSFFGLKAFDYLERHIGKKLMSIKTKYRRGEYQSSKDVSIASYKNISGMLCEILGALSYYIAEALTDCIGELIDNSTDAGASKVEIRVKKSLQTLTVLVVDNGYKQLGTHDKNEIEKVSGGKGVGLKKIKSLVIQSSPDLIGRFKMIRGGNGTVVAFKVSIKDLREYFKRESLYVLAEGFDDFI